MRGFAPNTLISQPERLPRSDFRDCSSCCCSSDGHVDIFSSVSLSENRQAGTMFEFSSDGLEVGEQGSMSTKETIEPLYPVLEPAVHSMGAPTGDVQYGFLNSFYRS